MSKASCEKMLTQLGLQRRLVRAADHTTHPAWVVTCGDCAAECTIPYRPGKPPWLTLQTLINKGWDFTTAQPRCKCCKPSRPAKHARSGMPLHAPV